MIETLKHFNIIAFLRLIGLVLILYYFTVAFNGIVSPEGTFYSSFLDHHLNFIDWFRSSIMIAANLIAHAFGTNSYIASRQMMKVGNESEFSIWLPCLGFGVISFWISFIVNSSSTFKRKLKWCLLGIVSIWIINSIRIAFFVISVDKNWPQNTLIDHHDLFNIVAYVLIAIMMYSYTRKHKQNQALADQRLPKNLQNALPNR
jgi:exosortase/archaeosortase family protein